MDRRKFEVYRGQAPIIRNTIREDDEPTIIKMYVDEKKGSATISRLLKYSEYAVNKFLKEKKVKRNICQYREMQRQDS